MPTRFRKWQKERRIQSGAQFLVAGPILDPATVEEQVARLDLQPDDPPVALMAIPPFGPSWVARMESLGSIPISRGLRKRLEEAPKDGHRAIAWEASRQVAEVAEEAGLAGVILMGLRFETIIDEAALEWRTFGS